MITSEPLVGRLMELSLATVADAAAMLSALEPASTQNLQFFSSPLSLHRQVEYLQRMELSPSDVLYAIVETKTRRLIGTIGLHEIDTHLKVARLGLLIFGSEDRGHGFGNEATSVLLDFAFRRLGLNKVYVNVFAENSRGQDHWENLGFTVEGKLREEYLLNGTYHDLVRLTMLAREWATLNRKE